MPSAIPFKPAPPGSSRAPARPDPGNEIGRRPDSQAWRELQQRFRLTGAECRVALLLAHGLDAAELSLHLGVSRNTIKTQSQAVYQKLGVHRQAQLIRVMAGSPLRESNLPPAAAAAPPFSRPVPPAPWLFSPASSGAPFLAPPPAPPSGLRARVTPPPQSLF